MEGGPRVKKKVIKILILQTRCEEIKCITPKVARGSSGSAENWAQSFKMSGDNILNITE